METRPCGSCPSIYGEISMIGRVFDLLIVFGSVCSMRGHNRALGISKES